MAQLYLTAEDKGGSVVGRLLITAEEQTIGRSPDCSLQLPGNGVSRVHASVWLRGGRVVVADEGSANGVRVNDKAIDRPTRVSKNSKIQISTFTLRVEHRDEAPASTPPQQPARQGEPGDQDTRLEASADMGAILAHSVVRLVGSGGAYEGTTIEVAKPLITVGRDADNEVVLDDPSISRRHAQLRLSPDASHITVMDLRSSNGTFVGGKRTKRAEATGGMVVRFGDLPFRVQIGRRNREERPTQGLLRPRWIAAALVAVVLSVFGVIKIRRLMDPNPDGPGTPKTAEQALQHQIQEVRDLLERSKAAIASKSWQQASELLASVLELDPINREAQDLKRKVERAKEHQLIYADAKRQLRTATLASLTQAYRTLKALPPDSIYAADIRRATRQAAERIQSAYLRQARGQCRKKQLRTCYSSMCQVFVYASTETGIPDEVEIRRDMRRLESTLAKADSFAPCTAPRYTRRDADSGGADVAAVLEDFPATVRPMIRLYLSGNIERSLTKLRKRIKKGLPPKDSAKVAQLETGLRLIRDRYEQGFAFYRVKKADDADQAWTRMRAAERSLFGSSVRSAYRRETSRLLAELWFERGEEAFVQKRYSMAFQHWSKGKKARPQDPRIAGGLLRLEREADALLSQANTLPDSRAEEAIALLRSAQALCEPTRPISHKIMARIASLRPR